MSYFSAIDPIRFEGPDSDNPLAFRYYDKNRVVMGKSMQEHLRMAVCYWHSFAWPGGDPFGGDTFERPWFQGASPLALAEQKAEAAFDFFARLGAPYYCFHDRDVAPEGETPRKSAALFQHMVDRLAGHQERTGVKLLWGTANLFSHRRFMAGAATNPDPELFAMAATQVKAAMEATHRLGGENYVLWGGREGYETLLNTDIGQELDQMGRFLNLVVEHKHRIGFRGNDPDRTQTQGAFQAPVRLRCGHGVSVSSSNTGWSRRYVSTSRPTMPRWRATASSTKSRWRRRWASLAVWT
jgi:xylose isomerase